MKMKGLVLVIALAPSVALAAPDLLAQVPHRALSDVEMDEIRGKFPKSPTDAMWPGMNPTWPGYGYADPWGTAAPYPMPQANPPNAFDAIPPPAKHDNVGDDPYPAGMPMTPGPSPFYAPFGGAPYLLNPVPLPLAPLAPFAKWL
jgi:hypothetical protein